ncbi:sensor histidine kinase [Chitinophaga defluvii]|uniref:Histidine kinase n=1 Tax=Chitinophaga defluvii TaxID=3163343 RepID=A0ABV2SZQ9_9BACT
MKQVFYNSWLANIFLLALTLLLNYLITKHYGPPENNLKYLAYNTTLVTLVYCLTVIHNVFILRQLTDQQRYWRYALLLLTYLITSTLLLSLIRTNIFHYTDDGSSWIDDLAFNTVFLFVGIGVLYLYRQTTQQTKELKNSLLLREKEIQYLQSQLNPHFFFNTLNNLYGVSLRFPKKTPELILSISELMRYQLESSQKQRVPLTDELQFIRNYMHLERARIRQRCRVNFKKRGDEQGLFIAPLILIAFIENAFKYAPACIQGSYIKVELQVKDKTLFMKISNTVPESRQLVSSTRVGLSNVQQRLELMYANTHTLSSYEENKVYYTSLSLVLDTHE